MNTPFGVWTRYGGVAIVHGMEPTTAQPKEARSMELTPFTRSDWGVWAGAEPFGGWELPANSDLTSQANAPLVDYITVTGIGADGINADGHTLNAAAILDNTGLTFWTIDTEGTPEEGVGPYYVWHLNPITAARAMAQHNLLAATSFSVSFLNSIADDRDSM